MPTREDLLRQIWKEVINAPMNGIWIDHMITTSKKTPNAPFADAGVALEKILANGINRRDLSLATRAAIYQTIFVVLYMLDDPGVDDGNVFMLHESLLTADPSGNEGRPGSAP